MKVFVIVLGVIAVAQSTPVAQDDNLVKSVIGNLVECVNSDLDLCLKEHALKAADRLSSARKLKIFDGLTLINNAPRESRSLESLSEVPDVRSKQLTERLWKSSSDLLQGSELELSYGGAEDEDESRAIDDVEESRGKKKKLKKKLKVLIPLMILAKAKAVALAVLALLVIAASVFKLALIAKLAFIIKIIAIIKALLLAKKHHTEETWEIATPHHGWESHVEHPHVEHEHHGHGWEGGWSRSRNEAANNLAYSAYAN